VVLRRSRLALQAVVYAVVYRTHRAVQQVLAYQLAGVHPRPRGRQPACGKDRDRRHPHFFGFQDLPPPQGLSFPLTVLLYCAVKGCCGPLSLLLVPRRRFVWFVTPLMPRSSPCAAKDVAHLACVVELAL
jgi:hypothetical protein